MSIPKQDRKVNNDPEKKWSYYKMQSFEMAKRLGKYPELRLRAERMAECGTVLAMEKCPVCHRKHIKGGHMCHDRLCPLCQWRLSSVRFAQMLRCIEALDDCLQTEKASIGMLTLTLRNVPLYKLRETLFSMASAWKYMSQRKFWNEVVIGSARHVEITYNPNTDTYHPHLHILLITREMSDFMLEDFAEMEIKIREKERKQRVAKLKEKGKPIPEQLKNRITTVKNTNREQMFTFLARHAWKQALKIDYNPVIDYRYAYNKADKHEARMTAYNSIEWAENKKQAAASAARECAKYVIGQKTLTEVPDKDLLYFAYAISGLRMVSYTGCLKKARQGLNYKTEEITEIKPHEPICNCGATVVNYVLRWNGSSYTGEQI